MFAILSPIACLLVFYSIAITASGIKTFTSGEENYILYDMV